MPVPPRPSWAVTRYLPIVVPTKCLRASAVQTHAVLFRIVLNDLLVQSHSSRIRVSIRATLTTGGYEAAEIRISFVGRAAKEVPTLELLTRERTGAEAELAMRGEPARAIQEIAGHKDLSTTQRYVHLSPAGWAWAYSPRNLMKGRNVDFRPWLHEMAQLHT
jgi:hypothetical protein